MTFAHSFIASPTAATERYSQVVVSNVLASRYAFSIPSTSFKPKIPPSTLRSTQLPRPICRTKPLLSPIRIQAPLLHFGGNDGENTGGFSGRFPPPRDENKGNPEPSEPTAPLLAASGLLFLRQPYRRSYMRRHPSDPFPQSLADLVRSIRISHILLMLNVAVFAIQSLYRPDLLMAGAKVNSAIAAGEYYRLFSPMFLHASISHLLINSFSLHSTGPSVESWFGKKRFLSLYFASGLAGNLLSYMCSPTPAVGASGAIFGLVGASVVILGRHHKLLGPRARRGLQSLAYIVIVNFGMGMAPGSRIDNFGHLGGFLGGIGFSYLAGPRLVVRRARSGKSIIRDEPILSTAIAEVRMRLSQIRRSLSGK